MENKPNCYCIHFTGDDMGPSPSRWTSRGIDASAQILFVWGYLLLSGNKTIVFERDYFGEDMGEAPSLFHAECADGMFGQPQILYSNPMEEGDILIPLHLTDGSACDEAASSDKVYETSILHGEDVKALYRAGAKGCHVVEGDFLDITGKNAEYGLCIDPPGVFGPYFTWSTCFTGRYYGQDVRFMGGADRFYSLEQVNNLYDGDAYYFANIISGVNADGSMEYGCFYMFNGRSFAYYVKDGEEPRCSEDVKYKAEWALDPADPNRVAPRSIVWGFDDIEVHWQAECTSLYFNSTINHFGHWYEKNGSRDFVNYLGAFESNIQPQHLKSLGITF